MSNQIDPVPRNASCYFCNNFFEEKYLYDHVKICGSVLEECPFKCGVYVARKNMDEHRKICDRNAARKNSQTNNARDSAWRDKMFHALKLLRSALRDEEAERKVLQDRITYYSKLVHTQQGSIDALHFRITEMVDDYRQHNVTLNQRLNNLELASDNTEQRTSLSFQRISEQLELLHDELGGEQHKHDEVLAKWCEELKDLRTVLAKDSAHVNELWQEQQRSISDLKLELEMRCKDSKEIMRQQKDTIEKVNRLEEEMQKQFEIIAKEKSLVRGLKFKMAVHLEHLDRLDKLMTENSKSNISQLVECHCTQEHYDQCSTNGRLLWKIERYKEKMTEAKEKNCVLYSPTFLDKEYGYTLRMELFLNGLGQWKDRHIIGCLRVENGKWDPLLDWPCILKASVTLRNQEDPANDIKKIVKAVKDSKDVTKEAGIYMFIPHTTLTRYTGYVKDNSMFLDVRIIDIRTSVSTPSLSTL